MDFDIVHLHKKFGRPYSYRNKVMARYNFGVTSDPVDLNGNNK